MFPFGDDKRPLLGIVYRWRAVGETVLFLLVVLAAALAAAPDRRRWWASRLCLVLLSASLPVAVLEVALRAGWIDPPFTAYRGGSEVFRPNYLLGWSNAPGAVTEHFSPDFRVAVRINGRGERGPDIPLQRAPGTNRILMLGDSFTFGAGVEQHETFSARLAARLPATEVINTGVTGYSLDQQYLYLRHEGLRYTPDAVIVAMFPGNDFGELGLMTSYGFPRPYFTLEQGRLVGHPLTDREGGYQRDPRPISLRRLSRAAQLVERTVSLWSYSRQRQIGRPATPPEHPATDGAWLSAAQYPTAPATADLAKRLLAAIQAECEAAGCRLLVLLIPAPETVAGPPGEGDTQGYQRACEYVAARRIAAELGLPLVDPLDRLAARSAAGETLYHPNDGHWTAEAHALAAEALEAELLQPRPPSSERP